MQIVQWYIKVLRDYALFRGRARRQEFWFYFLANCVIVAAYASTAGTFMGWLENLWSRDASFDLGSYEYFNGLFGFIFEGYALAVLLPSLAVTARRLHDSGRSGWWLLLALVPSVGWIVLLTLCSIDSEPGENRYGGNPKRISTAFEDRITAT